VDVVVARDGNFLHAGDLAHHLKELVVEPAAAEVVADDHPAFSFTYWVRIFFSAAPTGNPSTPVTRIMGGAAFALNPFSWADVKHLGLVGDLHLVSLLNSASML